MSHKKIDGLTISDIGNNKINISEGTLFKNSEIYIDGENNTIIIEECKLVQGLRVNFKGNGKVFFLRRSRKKIKNLKLVSHRQNNQYCEIKEEFGCGGLEVQMNDGEESLLIGEDCLFSWGIKIRTSDGHSVIDLESGRATNTPQDIVIGNHVWVGEDAKLLKGASIPDDCIVASFSVVTKPFYEKNNIIAGFPASVVKKNVSWHREMPRIFNERNFD
ncbi:acyltransferase [Halomonas urumqiensis]|uniref:Acyltransferase n=1 Tax=Halomonas urumqiensis TaxID=1684789 RepID=A0A2N7UCF8_9GAMM|nr:hypothetical protein [Halomonas urumqiensis]PMR78127.1 hypothetical protein C1H70_15230 [Halomonas urumqiensis]PTB03277.1 hypothetical protein C6V82_01870 [Halomonas urumqiensis]GHE20563.1 hypothetical protein GCM10017767_10840 [Halomonas urumqiensis]